MLHFFRILFFLIDIDQKTVLNWFGVKYPVNFDFGIEPTLGNEGEINSLSTIEPVSFETVRLIINGLWDKIQDGLTLADIENILFYILVIRFLILAIRYNLKTSFYITCIGLFAGYLWYRHLIDVILVYRNVLLGLPFLNKLGLDAVELRSIERQIVMTNYKLAEKCHWYNPGQLIYYALRNALIDMDPKTGLRHYIDPVSMIMYKIQNYIPSYIVTYYYKLYNGIIPNCLQACSEFSDQLSGTATYALVTRFAKKYCPYLVRWHWTFLLISGFLEEFFVHLFHRIVYFQTEVIIPQLEELEEMYGPYGGGVIRSNLSLQVESLNSLMIGIVVIHIGFVLFGLFHAIWGQYFYVPFLIENAELHIGPRPKNSIYSGGNTAWQDSEEKSKSVFPKFWYGWLGSGTKNRWKWISFIFRAFKKRFRN